MGLFHVFVDGPIDDSPEALRRLAEAMHQRYGLVTSDLLGRLAKGRFRVKGNIDEKTANVYARDLEAIGARVTVEPSDGERDRSGLINLPPVESSRAGEPTPAGGTPRARPTSGAPGTRPSSGKLGPVIERTKQQHDDRRDQLSARGATTKAPLGVDRPAAASNPPPLGERERPSAVALGAAGPSNAAIRVPGPSVDLDLGAAGGSGEVGARHAHVEAGDFDLGAPGATIPIRNTPIPTSGMALGASGVGISLPERGGGRLPAPAPLDLGAPGAATEPYPVGPDGTPLLPRTRSTTPSAPPSGAARTTTLSPGARSPFGEPPPAPSTARTTTSARSPFGEPPPAPRSPFGEPAPAPSTARTTTSA
ncbi:MAG: hypothetical protein KF773_08890, partial [Deltaproteobacteria bacterium]|nr:hypothetical protein [Deltaproteobacteria bacterium]